VEFGHERGDAGRPCRPGQGAHQRIGGRCRAWIAWGMRAFLHPPRKALARAFRAHPLPVWRTPYRFGASPSGRCVSGVRGPPAGPGTLRHCCAAPRRPSRMRHGPGLCGPAPALSRTEPGMRPLADVFPGMSRTWRNRRRSRIMASSVFHGRRTHGPGGPAGGKRGRLSREIPNAPDLPGSAERGRHGRCDGIGAKA
jgi:hypothetical protein